MTQTVLCN